MFKKFISADIFRFRMIVFLSIKVENVLFGLCLMSNEVEKEEE